MSTTDKIFLTGFMGSGKSTQGKKLAKALNRSFIDLDHYIEKKEAATIAAIFETKGEDYFREKESEYLTQVINRYPTSVISTGGGTPCFHKNMALMLKSGTVIYISMPAESLHYRLVQSNTNRPLLAGKTPEEALEHIRFLLNKRESYYNQAHITINGVNLTTDKLKEALSLFSANS
ncbi:MAG: shikimate kinase [Bacteroidia bacterium]